ncbi:hypothetical protein L210DRAFT_3503742 [Boletus edulis BED1]|uniref:Uncharacterized protein n=1 Tax=Boletus edulis BED1 TaxID=1328754 RepID=A0AAD4BVD6_BOLED|nr:hypothetical protein L210DRAFT_3503742 [Boletus edulis BED1]
MPRWGRRDRRGVHYRLFAFTSGEDLIADSIASLLRKGNYKWSGSISRQKSIKRITVWDHQQEGIEGGEGVGGVQSLFTARSQLLDRQHDGIGGGLGIDGGVHRSLFFCVVVLFAVAPPVRKPRESGSVTANMSANAGLFVCLITHGVGAGTDMTGATVATTKAAESTARERILYNGYSQQSESMNR